MLNKIVMMGRLTRDPELRQTQSGNSVASFTLACDRDFAAQGAEKETDFVDVVAWRGTAEFVSKYFSRTETSAKRQRSSQKAFISATASGTGRMLLPLHRPLRSSSRCRAQRRFRSLRRICRRWRSATKASFRSEG